LRDGLLIVNSVPLASDLVPMIVCSCNVLSDKDVRSAVQSPETGARRTSQVYGCLGCNAQCGRCARTIKRIMDEALSACGDNPPCKAKA